MSTYSDILKGVGSLGGKTSQGIGAAINNGKTTYIGADGAKKKGVFTGSAGGIGVNSTTQQSIKDQMNANSQAWHTATSQEEKDRLHAENKRLQAQLGGSVNFNPGTGTWGGTADRDYEAEARAREEAQRQEMRDYYAQIAAQQEAAKRAAVEQAVGQLEGQKGTVSQSYDDLMRQLYIDRRKAEKNLPQQMAAMGYTGGLTESSALGLQTGYAEALRQGEQQKTTTLTDIDRAISDARLSGEISIAEQAAQLAQQGLLSYTDLVRAQQEQANWEKQFGLQQGQFDWQKTQGAQNQSNYEQELAYQKEQDALKWAYQRDSDSYDRALTKWQLTGVLDEESAAVLGLPAGTKTTDYSYQLAQLAKKTGSTRTTGQTDPNAEKYSTLLSRFQRGDHSDEVINGLLSFGVPMEQLVANGYQGGGQTGGTTSQPSISGGRLSTGGEMVYSQIRMPGLNKIAQKSAILFALDGGKISEADAALLLQYVNAG